MTCSPFCLAHGESGSKWFSYYGLLMIMTFAKSSHRPITFPRGCGLAPLFISVWLLLVHAIFLALVLFIAFSGIKECFIERSSNYLFKKNTWQNLTLTYFTNGTYYLSLIVLLVARFSKFRLSLKTLSLWCSFVQRLFRQKNQKIEALHHLFLNLKSDG